MNSRNAFLIAGAAVLILIVAVLLLLAGGGDDGDSGGTDTEDGNITGAPGMADTAAAFEALFNGDAGPFKNMACGDADATLDSLATELAALPRTEGAVYSFVCDTSALAGDCQAVATVGEQQTSSFLEFGVTEGEICNPIVFSP